MTLLNYLPDYLRDIREFQELMNVEDIDIGDIKTSIQDYLDQKYIDSATWGLENWEREIGLQVNPSLSYEDRRSRIKGRLRGTGKVDSDLIKQVVDSWTDGDVDVTFDGTINVKFNAILGITSNIDDVKNAINEIKPAHLGVAYLFNYYLINEVESMTIAQLETQTLDKFAGGEV